MHANIHPHIAIEGSDSGRASVAQRPESREGEGWRVSGFSAGFFIHARLDLSMIQFQWLYMAHSCARVLYTCCYFAGGEVSAACVQDASSCLTLGLLVLWRAWMQLAVL